MPNLFYSISFITCLFLSLFFVTLSGQPREINIQKQTHPKQEIVFSSEQAPQTNLNTQATVTSTKEKRFQVCVYAIAKNEESKVEPFMSWAKYADEVHILDTGSTDRTIELFKKAGAKVSTQTFTPFRFDHARNAALKLLSASCEIAVTGDLDNVYNPETQWRDILEKIWASNNINRLDFPWFYDMINFPTYSNYDKKYIHSRTGFEWQFPIHEKLLPQEGVEVRSFTTDEIQLLEYPTPGVVKRYTPLLELAVKEYPDSAAHHLWLALDYHAQERFLDAIEQYKQHLSGGTLGFDWVQSPHLRAFSKRTIGKSYYQAGDNANAEDWYKEAVRERPDEREVWNDLATFYFLTNRFMESYLTAHRGWQVSLELRRWDWPVDDCAWSWCIPSLLGRAAFEMSLYGEACTYSKLAYEHSQQPIDKETMEKACAIPLANPQQEFPLT